MKTIIQTTMMLLVFTIITGALYPAVMTLIGQVAFPTESSGSLVTQGQKVKGSLLIAQKFEKDFYFWPRPSASDYSAVPSGASNLGPTSAKLKELVSQRRKTLAAKHETTEALVPADLITASGSGLDPHISEEAARFQISRVAKARKLDSEQNAKLSLLVDQHTEARQWTLFGQTRVNVLALNLALDKTFPLH